MSIAITEDHRALGQTASDFLAKHDSRGAARALLEAETETVPAFWGDLAPLGWLGVHLPEARGGSGFGLPELVVVVEELGRAVAPGPFVPTVIASAVVNEVGPDDLAARLLPGLADGSVLGGVGLTSDLTVRDGRAAGTAPAVLGGGLANVLVLPAGDDAIVVDTAAGGVTVAVPANLDPTRRSARVTLDGAPVVVIPGGRQVLVDLARLLVAAEATGVATECTEQAAAYAKVRVQFGRPIAMFEAVKHHCANMLVASELATAAVWDAARAAEEGGDQLSYAAAMAAALALAAGDECAQLNIQVHGGIGFTWEHDAHLYLRRATALEALVDAEDAARDVTDLVRAGVRRTRTIDLPPEAEPIRDEVRAFAERVQGLDAAAQRAAMIETGYVMPHWPTPWGRDAGAVEQLVIEQEFRAAGVTRPQYGITGWVILTLIQHATEDQVARWVMPALRQEVIWCQLFSEPDAGSDAAGIKTRGHPGRRRVAGQRPEGVDERRALRRLRPGHHPHRSRRPQARGHHHHGHRHARGRRGGAPAQDGHGAVGVQRGLLQRRLRARRRRGGAGQRRLDRRPGDARQRERVHRGWPGRDDDAGRHGPRALRRQSRAPGRRSRPGRSLHRAERGHGGAQHAQRPPCRGGRRTRTRGQRHQAGAVRDRSRGGGHHGRRSAAPRRPTRTGRARSPR